MFASRFHAGDVGRCQIDPSGRALITAPSPPCARSLGPPRAAVSTNSPDLDFIRTKRSAMVEHNTLFGVQLKWISLLTLVVQNR